MSEPVNSGSGPSPLRDARTAIVVANELRYALIRAVIGGSRAEANVVTGIAAGVAVGGAATVFGRIFRLRPPNPTLADAVLVSAVARESAHRLAGPWSRATPIFSTLIVLVLIEKSFGPTLRGAIRAVRDSVHRVGSSLHRLRLKLDEL